MKCPNCNAEIADTSKFCTKCGTRIEAASRVEEPKKEEPKKEEPKAAPAQKAIPPMPSQPWKKEPAPEPVEVKKSKKLPIPVIVVAAIVVLGVAFLALRKPADSGKGNAGNAVASIPAPSSSQTEQTTATESEQAGSQVQTESSQLAADGPKGDPALLNEADEKAVAAQNALNDGSYGDAISQGTEAIKQYMDIARANHLKEEAQDKIAPVFQVISDAAMTYSQRIEEQEMGNAGFNEVRNTVRPVLRLHESLTEEGYSIDASALETYYDGVIPRFKEYYIRKINEITERDQWSRDEAWTYASQAYAIQDNGTTLLFDEEDLEDPLKMRFVYCRSWIYRKRCETGLADGSMTNEDAFNYMTDVLEEIDYNLLVLDDLMIYGKAAGKDVSKYQAAYDAIIAELKDSQGLTIVNNGVNAGTTVDVKKFWYFNDLDGAEEYQVDTVNGTTQETRKWIRENIPEYLK
ncbi:MAG: zinc ribbon domain-containing protein [Lachnospiraceae bacterium]|nr:zinc ribbon domain-containing protein [Lachnospiraceae bacterium]